MTRTDVPNGAALFDYPKQSIAEVDVIGSFRPCAGIVPKLGPASNFSEDQLIDILSEDGKTVAALDLKVFVVDERTNTLWLSGPLPVGITAGMLMVGKRKING